MTEVRRRTDADLPELVVMLRGVYETDGYPRRWHEPADLWLTPDTMSDAWVAYDGDRLLGHVVLEDDSPRLLVGRLFAAVDARGLGVADALLGTVEETAATRGRELALEVDVVAVQAIARYERRGWTRTGTRDAPWLNADGTTARCHDYVAPVSR